MDILGIGFAEIVFILIIAMMVFGPRRLPEIAAKAGKTVRDLRNMSNGLLAEWQREITVAARLEELEKAKQEFNQIKDDFTGVKQELTDVKTSVTDVTKTISPPKLADLEAAAMGKSKDQPTQKSDVSESDVETDVEQPQQNEASQPVSNTASESVESEDSDVEQTPQPQTAETPAVTPNGKTTSSPKETTPVPPSEPEKLVND